MKSERNAAVAMLSAALIGLVLANSPISAPFLDFLHQKVVIEALSIEITLGHLASDLLLAIFFLGAGLELKYELTLGTLSSFRKAAIPVVAALGGVIVPALVYLSFTFGTSDAIGWPIPTATDIAFALGVLALFGTGMPKQARIFLLALAIFDDLIAITIIAIFYTSDLSIEWLGISVLFLGVIWWVEHRRGNKSLWVRVALGIVLWYFVYRSGIHPTVAGVALGLMTPARKAHGFLGQIQKPTNFIVLPIFAITAVAIKLPEFETGEMNIFLGVFFALTLGKLVGISGAAWLINRLQPREHKLNLGFADFAAIGLLGGIGFTVSLLMSQLAFRDGGTDYAQAAFGVLLASLVAMTAGGWLVTIRSKHHRKIAQQARKLAED